MVGPPWRPPPSHSRHQADRAEDPSTVETTVEELQPLYRQMLAIRRMEEASRQGVLAGQDRRLPPPRSSARRRCASARSPRSSRRTTSSRPTASTATRTPRASPRAPILAELYGKKTGAREGPRRLDAPVRQEARTSSAATASSAATCRSRPARRSRRSTAATARVTLCFFGEGASTIGGFAEGLALAALWKLPVVFICENNQYSMGTPLYRSLAVEDVSLRALAHGMARDRFDGDDVIKVQAPHRRGGRARAHDRRADARRGRDLPLPRPLDVRPGPLPHQGRGRGVEAARSAQPLARAARRARHARGRARRARGRRQGRDRGRGEVRRGLAGRRRVPART